MNDLREKKNDLYPILPLRDIVVYPNMVVPLFVGREKSIQAGLLPFVPSELFKIALAVALIPTLNKFIKN